MTEVLLRFSDVTSHVATVDEATRLTFDRATQHWQSVFERCAWFLRGLHPDVFSGSEKGICLVFDMNRLFEAFASLAIAHAISDRDLRIHFQGPQKALMRDTLGTEAFRLKPDIVVMHRSGQTLLIADAKWKLIDADDAARTMSASDVYQMLAYARRYEVDEVVLIYPAQRGLTPNEVLSFQTELDHIRLHAFGLDLVDPQSVGSALIQYLRKVGTQPLQLSA